MFQLKRKEIAVAPAYLPVRPRVCLVSPGHLSTNPRLVKEANAFGSANFEVSIVHGRYSAWGTQNDTGLVSEEWRRLALPFGPFEASRTTYVRQTLVRKGARLAARLGASISAINEAAHSPLVRDLIAATAGLPPADLYVAHYVAALPAAARAARQHGAVYSFDAEDFHLGDQPDDAAGSVDHSIIRAIEETYLPGARYVTAASPGIADAYAAQYGIERPTVVLNVFSKAQASLGPTPRGSAAPGPSVYWFSQTIGPDRGLECAVRAMAAAKTKPHFYVRGTLARGFEAILTGIAREAGVMDRLHILSPAPPTQMERLAAGYDIGLASETGATHNHRLALSNKQFTYLLAGVPAVMSDVPSHRNFSAEAQGAAFLYRTEDPAALAAQLDFLLGDPATLAKARFRAFQLGQERFNWEHEQVKILECARTALRANAHAKSACV